MKARTLVWLVCVVLVQSTCGMFVVAAAAQVELISTTGTGTGNNSATIPVTTFSRRQQSSADGRFVVFQSGATDLVAGFVDGNGSGVDVYVRDRVSGTTTLVSVNAAGTASGNKASTFPVISADGRFVAFVSAATDLVAGIADTNADDDVFVRDLVTSTTSVASVNASGAATGNKFSNGPLFSPDGTTVAFASAASDLVSTPVTFPNIFLRDLMSGETSLLSIDVSGTGGGNGESYSATAFSADGGRILFSSDASNLTSDTDTNGTTDIFVRDLPGGPTTLVSVTTSGTAPSGLNDISTPGNMSADGNRVVFSTFANTLDLTGLGDGNGSSVPDVVMRDLAAGTSTLVSVNASGTTSGSGPSSFPSISADGRFVAFASQALNLEGPPKAQIGNDIYVRDLVSDTTTLVSVNSAGTFGGNGASGSPMISRDGSRVLFASAATDLVDAGISDTNGASDVFVRDLAGNATTLASINVAGDAAGNGPNFGAGISNGGGLIVFVSSATDLTDLPDTNGASGDIFAFELAAPSTTTTTTMPTTTTTTTLPGGVCGDPVSSQASIIAVPRAGETNASDALFVLRTAVGNVTCDLCVCDVNDSGTITASDALIVLQFAVGQPVVLNCPPCSGG